MIEYSDKELSKLWLNIFKKKGMNTECSKPFTVLSIEIQQGILQKIKLDKNEIAILVSFQKINNFTLLTSRRLISIINDQIKEISIQKIKTDDYDDWRKMKINGWQIMKIENKGNSFEFLFEGGGPLVGMVNVIKNIIQRNEEKKHPTTAST